MKCGDFLILYGPGILKIPKWVLAQQVGLLLLMFVKTPEWKRAYMYVLIIVQPFVQLFS